MEKKKLNQMLDNIIKRILKTPTSTPREALYIETGLLDIETIDDKNRITMGERLEKKQQQPTERNNKLTRREGRKNT